MYLYQDNGGNKNPIPFIYKTFLDLECGITAVPKLFQRSLLAGYCDYVNKCAEIEIAKFVWFM